MQQVIRNNPARALLQHTCLAAAIVLAIGSTAAFAADSTPKAQPDKTPAPSASTPSAVDTEQARKELEQMREQMREM